MSVAPGAGMPDLAGLPENMQKELTELMETMQIKEGMGMMNRLTSICFNTCVVQFRSKELNDSEDMCCRNCVKKYVHAWQRINMRMTELTQASDQQLSGMGQGAALPK